MTESSGPSSLSAEKEQNVTDQLTHFLDLPNELLRDILSFLCYDKISSSRLVGLIVISRSLLVLSLLKQTVQCSLLILIQECSRCSLDANVVLPLG